MTPYRFVCLSAILLLGACVHVDVDKHLTASDYTRNPKRILVVMPSDENFGAGFDRQLSDMFKAGMQSQLTACGVTVLVYQADPMELNGPAKAKAAIAAFAPEALLLVQHTQRYLENGDERGETYVLTLHDNAEHRDVWKAAVEINSSDRLLTDRSHTGANLAAKVVRQMSQDSVLKSCPVQSEGKT